MTDALRYDDGKPELHYLDTWYNALCEVAQVCMAGTAKYERGNYLRGQPYSQLISAAYRHLGKFGDYRHPDHDSESGRHHVAHAIWNLLQLLELDLNEENETKDDRLRPPPEIKGKTQAEVDTALEIGNLLKAGQLIDTEGRVFRHVRIQCEGNDLIIEGSMDGETWIQAEVHRIGEPGFGYPSKEERIAGLKMGILSYMEEDDSES